MHVQLLFRFTSLCKRCYRIVANVRNIIVKNVKINLNCNIYIYITCFNISASRNMDFLHRRGVRSSVVPHVMYRRTACEVRASLM